jgi:hypothetical protein
MTRRPLIVQLALLGALFSACGGTAEAPIVSGSALTAAPVLLPTPTPSLSGKAQVTPGPSPVGSPGQGTTCPGRVEAVRSLGTPVDDKSTDWAGYGVSSTSTPFTCVEATWTQPAVICQGTSLKAVAFWVGIGGVGQAGLVQTGTETQCTQGSPVISVWQQSLPKEAYAVAMDLAVSVGDRVHAKVLAVSRSSYTMTVENLTTGATVTATAVNKAVDPTTAEWIAEAPTLGCPAHCLIATLPDFGTVTFTGVSTTIGGVNAPLDAAGFAHTRTTLATTSGLARASVSATGKDGRSFAVTWERP